MARKLLINPWFYQGNQVSNISDMPSGCIGFIYKLTDETGKFYVGKKSINSITNPEVSYTRYLALKKEGVPVVKTKNKAKSSKSKTVWRYKIKNKTTETNWRTYHGSNQELNAAWKKGANIDREILKYCFNKSELTLREVEEQFKQEVLFRCDCYNSNILGKFFKQVKC